jgi:hypothetical protein
MRREHRRISSEKVVGLALICLVAFMAEAVNAAPFSLDDIHYWVGSGANRSALVIDWAENSTDPPALVWGYRWDGAKHGNDMLLAILSDDPRLFAKLGGSPTNPDKAYGLGFDANNNDQFAVTGDPVDFDQRGIAFTDPPDQGMAADAGDYYAEGWYLGFWHYGVAATNPFSGAGSWSDISQGMATRTLADGSWDSWTFSPSFNFASFPESPVAAEPPFSRGDFNHDGHVDVADYAVWRATYGSSSNLAADANGNSVVDAADYVVWRRNSGAVGNASASFDVPEPSCLLLCVLFVGLFVSRQKLTNCH